MKRIAWITALVLGTLMSLILLWQFRQAIVVFLLSLAAAASIRPVIDSLTRRGVRPGIALLIAYLALILLMGGLLTALSRTLVGDLEQMTNNLAEAYENINRTWPARGDALLATLASQLPPAPELFEALGGEEGRHALQGLLGTASSVAGFFGQVTVILILSLYWSADRVHFERLWMSLIPVDLRIQARTLWRNIETGAGKYILGEIVQSYLVVLILWMGFSWIGLPQPTLLALVSALCWFIPWLGAVLALIPVILLGLTISPGVALAAGVLTVLVLAVMEMYVQPRFYSRQRFNSLFLVMVVIILTQAFGLLGLIVAPVLAAVLQIGFQHLALRRERDLRLELVSEEINQLQSSLLHVRQRIGSLESGAAPELVNLTERLMELVDKTTDYLVESGEVPLPHEGS